MVWHSVSSSMYCTYKWEQSTEGSRCHVPSGCSADSKVRNYRVRPVESRTFSERCKCDTEIIYGRDTLFNVELKVVEHFGGVVFELRFELLNFALSG